MSVSASAFIGALFSKDGIDKRVVTTAVYEWSDRTRYLSISFGGDLTLFLDRETASDVIAKLSHELSGIDEPRAPSWGIL